MFERLGKLRLWQKLTALFVLMGLPIGVLLTLYVNQARARIVATQKEQGALEIVGDLRKLLELVAQHRGSANAVLNGDPSLKGKMLSVEPPIQAGFDKILISAQGPSADLGAATAVESVRASWSQLRAETLSLTPKDSFGRHTRLVGDLLALLKQVGNTSGLTTDPELDTHYLSNSLLIQLSGVAEHMGQLRGLGAGVAARGKATQEEQVELTYLTRIIDTNLQTLRQNLRAAFEANPALGSELERAGESATTAAASFSKLATDRLVRVDAATIKAQDYFNTGTGAINEAFSLYDRSLVRLNELLQARATRLYNETATQLGLALLTLVLALGIVYTVSSGIRRQLQAITGVFSEIAMCNFSARAEITSRDELGEMAADLNATLNSIMHLIRSNAERDNIQESVRKLLDEISGVAAGDLTKEAAVTAEFTGAIADSFNYMISELRTIIGQVQRTTNQVTSSAQRVGTTADQLAVGSEQQATQIAQASVAMEGIARAIQQVSANADTASQIAAQSRQSAQLGAVSVRKTIEGMHAIRGRVQNTAKRIKRLGESSQEIGEIVQLIDDIADRTSILALNASIQAASAGEAGKGFAVVAEEVERLAERSTEATKRIASLIRSIQSDTNEAVSAMEETTHEVVSGSELADAAGQTLTQIETVSSQLADVVEQISRAALQQATGTEEVARNMGRISQVTQSSVSGAREASDLVKQLATLTEEMRNSLKRFKVPEEPQRSVGAFAD